jgi:hypothetical protein
MNRRTARWLAILVAFVPAGSLLAHHSLVNYDTTMAVRVKGTVVQIHQMNPHSFIYLEQTDADGQSRRWAAEGPSVQQLNRTGFAKDGVNVGDVIEICGYLPKEPIVWQIRSPDPHGTSVAGRLINAELLVTADGRQRSWGDYGVHACFAPGYTDQHSK